MTGARGRVLVAVGMLSAAGAVVLGGLAVRDHRELRAIREEVARLRDRTAGAAPVVAVASGDRSQERLDELATRVRRLERAQLSGRTPTPSEIQGIPQRYVDELTAAAGVHAVEARSAIAARAEDWRRWGRARGLSPAQRDAIAAIMARQEFRAQHARYAPGAAAMAEADLYRDSYAAAEHLLGREIALTLSAHDPRLAPPR